MEHCLKTLTQATISLPVKHLSPFPMDCHKIQTAINVFYKKKDSFLCLLALAFKLFVLGTVVFHIHQCKMYNELP